MTCARAGAWLRCAAGLVLGLSLGACQLLVPKLEAPRVSVSRIVIDGGSPAAERLRLFLQVENPNDRPIALESLVAHLDLAGMPFATGASDAAFSLPASAATTVVLNVTADLRQALTLMAAVMSHGTVDYRLYGQVQLQHGLVHTLHFTHAGRVRL